MVPDRDPDVRVTIERAIHVQGIWTAVLYGIVALLLVGAVVYASVQRARIEKITNDTVTALCTFRHDLQQRYDQGVKFLVEHPDGIPGIPAETLQQSLHNQKETLESLRDLPCPTKEEGTEVLGAVKRPLRDGFVRAVNRARVDKGCAPLRQTGRPLRRSARRHSKAMANQDRLFHSTLKTGRWSKVGEVVGVGSSWQSIFFALMDSKEHRHILLDCAYDYTAVGIIARDRTWLTGRFYAR